MTTETTTTTRSTVGARKVGIINKAFVYERGVVIGFITREDSKIGRGRMVAKPWKAFRGALEASAVCVGSFTEEAGGRAAAIAAI